jgi:hypothetical protein
MFTKETILSALNEWLGYNEEALNHLKASPEGYIDVVQITLINVVSNVRFVSALAGQREAFDELLAAYPQPEQSASGLRDYAISICEKAIEKNKEFIELYKNSLN